MTPDSKFITIKTSTKLVEDFVSEVMLTPRLRILDWSKLTKQSPGLKIGYPAQHIASLLTGVEGRRTAARGDDLADGTEVKGCNRIDQLDTCKKCGSKVLRSEPTCSFCGSTDVERKDDSKWLFTIKSEAELELYTKRIDRILLILLDYPHFQHSDFETLSIKAFEIWPKSNPIFCQLLTDYHRKIYLEHIRQNPKKTPAPKNFWPYSFQFFKCKPIKTFECHIGSINSKPTYQTNVWVQPEIDRSTIAPEPFPIDILDSDEVDNVFTQYRDELSESNKHAVNWWLSLDAKEKSKRINRAKLQAQFGLLDATYLDSLELRDTSKAVPHANEYTRRQ
jgi:ribosomal protein L37E